MCSNTAIMECWAWLWRLKALLLVSEEAILFRKVPFSHVINDSFQCAHLSAACPLELSQVCLNEKGEGERVFLSFLKKHMCFCPIPSKTIHYKTSHPEPPPLWGHRWCIWSQCTWRSASDPGWTNTSQTVSPCDHTPDLNQTSTHPVTHHVDEQLPQRLRKEMTTQRESWRFRLKEGNADFSIK